MPEHPPRAPRLVGALLLACALAAGCGGSDGTPSPAGPPPSTAGAPGAGGYQGPEGAPEVAVAGDSITELSRTRILDALTDRYRVRIEAFTGQTIGEVTPALVDELRAGPDVVVVNLGTNDMDREVAGWRTDLDHVLTLVADVPCVAAVTVYDGVHPPAGANIGTQINARLGEAAATGSVHVIDWNAAVHRDPDLIVADGIHPSVAGQRWLAMAIRDAIDSSC